MDPAARRFPLEDEPTTGAARLAELIDQFSNLLVMSHNRDRLSLRNTEEEIDDAFLAYLSELMDAAVEDPKAIPSIQRDFLQQASILRKILEATEAASQKMTALLRKQAWVVYGDAAARTRYRYPDEGEGVDLKPWQRWLTHLAPGIARVRYNAPPGGALLQGIPPAGIALVQAVINEICSAEEPMLETAAAEGYDVQGSCGYVGVGKHHKIWRMALPIPRPGLEKRLSEIKSWMFPRDPSLSELARKIPEMRGGESGYENEEVWDEDIGILEGTLNKHYQLYVNEESGTVDQKVHEDVVRQIVDLKEGGYEMMDVVWVEKQGPHALKASKI